MYALLPFLALILDIRDVIGMKDLIESQDCFTKIVQYSQRCTNDNIAYVGLDTTRNTGFGSQFNWMYLQGNYDTYISE